MLVVSGTHTIHGIGSLVQPLETMIRSKLIPVLTGQPPPSNMKCVICWPYIPASLDGFPLINHTSIAEVENSASTKVSGPLKDDIL